MNSVQDVFNELNAIAPIELQMDFDNAGLLIGDRNKTVNKIIVALDITSAVINEAIEIGAQLIVSHHPVIWNAMKQVSSDNVQQAHVMKLIENGISAICMHTNLDIADGGVNDVLMHVLGLNPIGSLQQVSDKTGVGRYGMYSRSQTIEDMLKLCKTKLHCNGIKYVCCSNCVKTIGVMGGSGGNAILDAKKLGCDTYITSDIKYDQFLLAKEININLLDVGHFNSENVIIPVVAEYLQDKVSDAEVYTSAVHEQVEQFFV